MKVAFLSFGFGEYSVLHANALCHSAEVLLMLPEPVGAPYRDRLDPAVDYRPLPRPRLRQPLQQLAMIRQVLDHLRDFEPDIIHYQHWHLWFNLVLPFLRPPIVLTIHDPTHHVGDRGSQKTPRVIMNLGYRRARQIIVHSREVRDRVVADVGLPAEIVHVIPHIALGDETAQSHVVEEESLILFFGRIWKYKGLEYLIQAEPAITQAVPNARIMIAGEGEDFETYRRMMAHPDRFIVDNAYVADAQRAVYFRKASVVVLPYIEASQSGVIPVAYTFRKPVVATTVGGLPEMVDDGRTGYLVPPRDKDRLAEALVRLLQDKELRHRMGENGRQKLAAECSPSAVAALTFAVYEEALGAERRPATGGQPGASAHRHTRPAR